MRAIVLCIVGVTFLLVGLLPVYLSCKYFRYHKVLNKRDYIAFLLITIWIFWLSGFCLGAGIMEVIKC